MNATPLAGRSIVVTRPSHQSGRLARLVESAGGRALRYPVIGIEPHRDPALEAAIDSLGSFDWAIFISRNAVEQGFACLRERNVQASLPRAAAIGEGTRRALEAEGVAGVIAPEGAADSEALLAHPQLADLSGKRVLIFRGVGGRELLASTLRTRGAIVEYAECYRRTRPATDLRPLLAEWTRGAVDAVTVSSGEALANFAGLLGAGGLSLLRATPVFVPHPRVSEEARGLGIAKAVLAGASDEEMMAALVAYFDAAS